MCIWTHRETTGLFTCHVVLMHSVSSCLTQRRSYLFCVFISSHVFLLLAGLYVLISLSKVAVYDYILTTEDPVSDSAVPSDESHRDGAHMPEGETSTHVAVYTLHLSGLKQIYRHFLRQSDGAIIEVRYQWRWHWSLNLFACLQFMQMWNKKEKRVCCWKTLLPALLQNETV